MYEEKLTIDQAKGKALMFSNVIAQSKTLRELKERATIQFKIEPPNKPSKWAPVDECHHFTSKVKGGLETIRSNILGPFKKDFSILIPGIVDAFERKFEELEELEIKNRPVPPPPQNYPSYFKW